MTGRSVTTHWTVHAHPPGRVGIGSHMLQPVGAANLGPELGRAEGRRLFGLDPQAYEAGRPDYPQAVYQSLVHRCGLAAGARVLEIGPGTGLVTQRLLAEGAKVVAVEPKALP